jgi:hypothetical protein
MTSFILNDRMILYNDFLPELSKKAEVIIWAKAWDTKPFQDLKLDNVRVEKFPEVREMKYSLTLLRRLNDFTWQAKKINKTQRIFRKYNKTEKPKLLEKFLVASGFIANTLGVANFMEKFSRKLYLKDNRSPEALKRLQEIQPDVLITTSPLLTGSEPGIVAEATNLNIPVLAFVSSWDNLSTKNRFMFDYDGYILWSEQMEKDLNLFYPYARNKPHYVVGAPQFDVFMNEEYYISKEEFCSKYGLDPGKPIVLFTLGSPNLFNELPGAEQFLKRAATGEMGEIQVMVRPHPAKHNDPKLADLVKVYKNAFIQKDINPKKDNDVFTHDKSKIVDWVNTYRHVDIVIHVCSTTAIDGSIFNKAIVNVGFDPSGEKQTLAWHCSNTIHHYKPLIELNGMTTVNDYDQMVDAVNKYLKNPGSESEGRKAMVELVCSEVDGKAGKRYAEAIIDFLKLNN